ncbi:pyridoxine biosynthesis protein [Onygenales sp. PD_10]|nr:pyridoxine biosynthesis protein [Onygenales sp. PD_10]
MAQAARVPRWISQCRVNSYSSIRYLQTSSATQGQTLSYPLYPSVAQLLHEKGIPDSEISKIPASGPKGRLLKGDVLAYVGAISPDYSSNLSAQIAKLAHLDLSNIKIKPTLTPAPEQARPTPPPPAAREPTDTEVALPISLSSVLRIQKRIRKTLGVTIPLSTFVARATDVANQDLPASKSRTQSADALFDEILGINQPSPPAHGNFVPEIIAPEPSTSSQSVSSQAVDEADIIDILTGKAPTSSPKPSTSAIDESPLDTEDLATNLFSITVPVADKLRGETFLARMREVLQDEPDSLIF